MSFAGNTAMEFEKWPVLRSVVFIPDFVQFINSRDLAQVVSVEGLSLLFKQRSTVSNGFLLKLR